MPIKYQKVWDTMNNLEIVTSKICSAREILDSAVDRIQEHQYDKVETLLHAVDEFLQYYLQEFDEKFKNAWEATVGDLRDGDIKSKLGDDRNDPSQKYQNALNDFWEECYYPEEVKDHAMPPWGHSDLEYSIANSKKDKVIRWKLPVNIDDSSGEYYINFPDDLLEAAGLKEGDQVEWIDRGDGSYLLQRITKPLKMEEC